MEPVLGVDDGFPKATTVDICPTKHQSAGPLLSRDSRLHDRILRRAYLRGPEPEPRRRTRRHPLSPLWYGLGMVTLAGWLGIAFNRPRLVRTYAIILGLGAGLIGDEVGLLLTFGDYQSSLTQTSSLES